LKFIILDMR